MNCTNTYTNSGTLISAAKANNEAFHRRLRQLYPCVEDVSRLPQAWSVESKAAPLGLTYDNLGCYFRGGNGRREEDEKYAAAVRTDHPIPPSCLLYFFEITFISKGREGYMGLGLTSANAQLTKLPGWARESYGYHADDGNIFNGDGRGNKFGPKFTSGDVIGCGYNLVERKCFFTKNETYLGSAFEEIPSNILFYPTVGLKTPGEEVKANFGQEKFVYDIEQDLRSLRKNMTLTISNFPINDFGIWQETLHKLVQSWLLQNSYPTTAEAFTKSTKIECKENMLRIKQRNRIQQLVLNGRISEAISLTNHLCPGLLQNNPNLLFALKCRQFIELISGAENDFQPVFNYSDQEADPSDGLGQKELNGSQSDGILGMPSHTNSNNGCNGVINTDNCEKVHDHHSTSSSNTESMDVDQPISSVSNNTNNHHRTSLGNLNSNNTINSPSRSQPASSSNNKSADANGIIQSRPLVDTEIDFNEQKFAKLIHFGQELSEYLQQLDKLYGRNVENEKMLREAIGLIAFINPQESHYGRLLNPKDREPISQLLNSSILRAEMGDSRKPPASENLEEVMNHMRKLVRLNDSHGRWLVDGLYG